MSINTLQILNLRNIQKATLNFCSGLNLIHGDNGSGKSTLLEAIYLIARGRSYRTSRFGSVIRHGEASTTLFAETTTERKHRIGIQKTTSSTKVKVDGKEVEKLSDIAKITPLQIITPMSHEILERGPEYRRRFLEWGVFHVEHNHFPLYRKFLKNLRQRNMALRNRERSLEAWDHSLARLGEALNELRLSYFKQLTGEFETHAKNLGLDLKLRFDWKRGWSDESPLAEVLRKNREGDLQKGYTSAGPHRADFKVSIQGRSAFNTASRGQQKMIIVALHLAQASVMVNRLDAAPIILIDDLVSELDLTNRMRLAEYLGELQFQVFITSTDRINKQRFPTAAEYSIEAGIPKRLE
ncbi:MAG: DNA replication/repair protein RecF [Sedimenticola sp.]|nr:DNA replication/repair protein RecF [Sedimenticola sp.]